MDERAHESPGLKAVPYLLTSPEQEAVGVRGVRCATHEVGRVMRGWTPFAAGGRCGVGGWPAPSPESGGLLGRGP